MRQEEWSKESVYRGKRGDIIMTVDVLSYLMIDVTDFQVLCPTQEDRSETEAKKEWETMNGKIYRRCKKDRKKEREEGKKTNKE